MEDERRARVRGELLGLPALVVRVEAQVALVDAADEHHAHGRTAVRRRGRERRGLGLEQARVPGLREPRARERRNGSSPSSSSQLVHVRESTVAGLGYAASMAATRTIEIRTEIPGPRSRALAEREERVIAHPLLVHLPDLRRARGERDDHRRRRQRLRRLRGRRRRRERRPRASARSSRPSSSRRPASSTPTSPSSPTSRRSRWPSGSCALAPISRRDAGGVLQRRHGGGRERRQARAPAHGPAGRDRVRGRRSTGARSSR